MFIKLLILHNFCVKIGHCSQGSLKHFEATHILASLGQVCINLAAAQRCRVLLLLGRRPGAGDHITPTATDRPRRRGAGSYIVARWRDEDQSLRNKVGTASTVLASLRYYCCRCRRRCPRKRSAAVSLFHGQSVHSLLDLNLRNHIRRDRPTAHPHAPCLSARQPVRPPAGYPRRLD